MRGKKALGPRLAGLAAIAIAATIFATPVHAASDTARLHHTHQTESTQKSRSSATHSAAKPARHASHSVARSKLAPRSHRRDSQPDPVIMHRAHSTPRSRAAEAREHAALQQPTQSPAHPLTQSFPVHPQLAASHSAPQEQISAQPPVSVKKTLTTEDFMRAAGTLPSTPAMVSPVPPAYVPAPQSPSQRVDGFGAEGAILSTVRRNAAPAPTAPAAGTQPDPQLAALSTQSHEELAEAALQPRLPNLYSRNGRLIVPAPLVGSHDVLVHQNEMADAEGLVRIENDSQLAILRAKHQLVDIPESASLQLNPDLPDNRRCARPWSVKFATDMAHAFYSRFHQPLQINSAARTVQYQMHLEHINGNAAGVDGEAASPHLTGQAIDFAKRGMSITEIAWMRAYLKPLMDAGKLDVEEEFHQSCFHISIYRSYLPLKKSPQRNEVAQLGSASAEK